MPSRSFQFWQLDRLSALDQIAAAHVAIGGNAPGRRYATQQINFAYATLLSSHFQGFCRDLHSEAGDSVCAPSTDRRLQLLRKRLMSGRKLDFGNPNSANLAIDFKYFDFVLWDAMQLLDAKNAVRRTQLDELMAWRNAIAHQDFDPGKLKGRTTLQLATVRRWRGACEQLATDLDMVVRNQVATITGQLPW